MTSTSKATRALPDGVYPYSLSVLVRRITDILPDGEYNYTLHAKDLTIKGEECYEEEVLELTLGLEHNSIAITWIQVPTALRGRGITTNYMKSVIKFSQDYKLLLGIYLATSGTQRIISKLEDELSVEFEKKIVHFPKFTTDDGGFMEVSVSEGDNLTAGDRADYFIDFQG